MRPSLLLDFANTRRLDPRIAFTRASVGTYFDRNGVLKTAAVNEPRFDFDPVTGYCKGLLIEEARTNLLTYSSDVDNAAWTKTLVTVTANAIIAPDGTLTGDRCETLAGSQTMAHAIVSATATSHAYSVYTKAGTALSTRFLLRNSTTGVNFDIGVFTYATGTIAGVGWAVVDVGGGWFRLSYSRTTGIAVGDSLACYAGVTGGGVAAGDSWYLWGAQLESGAFVSSYIPTSSAPVTRSAEVVSIAAGNFSPWFNPAEGTLLVAASRRALDATRSSHLVNISDGTTANSFSLHVDSLAKRSFSVDAGASSSCALLSGDEVASTPWRAAAAYRAGDFALSINGAAVVADSSGPLPPVNQMWLGNRADGARAYNGHLSRVVYYPRRIANADLQELTR